MTLLTSYFAVNGFLTDINAPEDVIACLDDLCPAQQVMHEPVQLTPEEARFIMEAQRQTQRGKFVGKSPKTPNAKPVPAMDFSSDNINIRGGY